MARQREFDPDQLLDQALGLFWLRGYREASLDDLVAATGVQRYGIYSTFGNKHALLLAALDRYIEVIQATNLEPLAAPNAGLAEIREAIRLTGDYMTGALNGLGCLMCQTAIDMAAEDEAVATKAARYQTVVTGLLRRALHNAHAAGDLPPGTDIDARANALFGVLVSIPTLSRVSQSPAAVQDYIEAVLNGLV